MTITVGSMTPLFQVYDMRKSVAFYSKILGFEITATYEPDGHLYWAKLTHGDVTLMRNAAWEDDERPDKLDKVRILAHGDTELYFQCDDVDSLYENLKSAGANVGPPQEQHGRRETVLYDPDGYKLSFYASDE